jgi:Fic family protein
MHYQFEAIHPYEDGNGRIGRLLLILFLHTKGVLPTPLLYLSGYFERYRDQYNEERLRVSITGNWSAWLEFFLNGVIDQARDALIRSRRVRQLQTDYYKRLQERRESANAFALVDLLFTSPLTTQTLTASFLGITRPGARRLLDRLVDAQILTVRAYGGRLRFYIANEVFDAIDAPI